MEKIVFFSIPLFGHVNYGLRVAKALKKRGFEVTYYSGIAYKQFIENAGITFHSYSDEIEKLFSFKDSTYNNEYMQHVRAEELNHITEWYKFCHHLYTITELFMKDDIYKMEQPDLIIYDSAALWGRYISKYFGIKSIASCTPYTYPEQYALSDLNRFSRMIFQDDLTVPQVKRLIYVLNHQLNHSFSKSSPCSLFEPLDPKADFKLIYTVKEFQAGYEYLDEDTTYFCGVMQEENNQLVDFSDLLNKNKPNIYIAFGSIYNNPDVFRQLYESCKCLNYNFILNIGKTISIDLFSDFPENWKIVQNLNQFELLKNIDVFISHGGVNSVREAMHCGVPIIVLPTEGDTLCTAEDIKSSDLGVIIDIHDINLIGTAIEKVLGDTQIKENCMLLSEKMKNSYGLNGVADIIEKIIRSK